MSPAPVPAALETLRLDHGPALVGWRRSSRARRVSLRIDAARGAVIVTLPPRASRRAGLAFLTSNADWVATNLRRLPQETVLTDGAYIPIAGIPHPIVHVPALRASRLHEGRLEVAGDAAFLPRRVKDFLQAEARRQIGTLARTLAAELGIPAARISVRDTRSRWGSCSASRALSFSWRLVMAPPYVQHYVAAHEVAHLRHMHHQESFWMLVRTLTPHEAAAKAWLRCHGAGLLRVG